MTDPREALATVASFIEADRDYQHDERPDLVAALSELAALVEADPLAADRQDGPFCWCGHDESRHSQPGDAVRPFCNGCAFDAQEDDEADPRHEFEDAALIDERLRVQHQTTQNFVVAMRQVEGSADPEDDEDRNPLDDGLAYVQAHGDWHGSTVDLALHQVADLREVIERMGPQLAGVNAYADGPRRDLDSAQEVLMREVNRLAAYWAEPLLEAIEDQDGGAR
jgi:hypothetical protein